MLLTFAKILVTMVMVATMYWNITSTQKEINVKPSITVEAVEMETDSALPSNVSDNVDSIEE